MTQSWGRIGLVAPRYAPAIGGVERCVEMLARGLVAQGHVVEVITTDPTGRLPRVEDRGGVLVRRFPTVGHDGVFFVAPALAWWLFLHARRFAVIHAHSYHTPIALAAAIASRWNHVPLVVSPYYHGTGHSDLRRILHSPYRPIGNWLLHQSGTVMCISGAELTLLHRDFGPELATQVVPCGVATQERFAPLPRATAPGRVVVLTVGRLDAYKQTARLVAAMTYMPPSYHVVIIGDGPARQEITRLGAQLGVTARLHVLGHVSEGDLRTWYATANVLVTLSRVESFGLTLLEAAAAGCALVASDIPAHREVAGYLPDSQALLISVDCSPAELARSIQEAVGRDRPPIVEHHLPTWAGFVDGTITTYRAVTGRRSPGLREVPT